VAGSLTVGNNGKKMENAFLPDRGRVYETQYVASYTPTNAKLDGSYRKIDVECKGEGLKAQARKGTMPSRRPTENCSKLL